MRPLLATSAIATLGLKVFATFKAPEALLSVAGGTVGEYSSSDLPSAPIDLLSTSLDSRRARSSPFLSVEAGHLPLRASATYVHNDIEVLTSWASRLADMHQRELRGGERGCGDGYKSSADHGRDC